MPKRKDQFDVLLLVEIVVTLAIACVLSIFKEWQWGVVVGAMGAMIGLSMHAVVSRNAAILRDSLQEVRECTTILQLCGQIDLPELQGAKLDILDETVTALRHLADHVMSGERFYSWAFEKLDKCTSSVKAVSAMQEDQWESDRERLYYTHNRLAFDRTVAVDRIFLTTTERLGNPEARRPILRHVVDGLGVHIVFSPKTVSMTGRELIVNGITIFDDGVLYQDVVLPPGTPSGRIVYETDQVRAIMSKYQQLRVLAEAESPLLILTRLFGEETIDGELLDLLRQQHGSQALLQSHIHSGEASRSRKAALALWKRLEPAHSEQ